MLTENPTIADAQKLIFAQQFSSALPILECIWGLPQNSNNLFLASMLLNCYNKLGLYDKALPLGEALCAREGCWDSIKLSYAWCLYFAHFKTPSVLPVEKVITLLERIEDLSGQKQALNPLVLSTFAFIATNNQLAPTLVLQLLAKLDCNLLDDKPSRLNGKPFALPSPKEQYICHYSKALFMAEQYPQCIDYCKQALAGAQEANLPDAGEANLAKGQAPNTPRIIISPDNLVWIKRRLALSMFHTGDYAPANTLMQEIVLRKQDWFLYHELSKIALAMSHNEDALGYAVLAAITAGDVEMKIHLWDLLYEILATGGYYQQAVQVLSLAASIRYAKGWKMEAKLIQELAKFNLTPPNLPNYRQIYQELKPWLTAVPYLNKQSFEGVIASILPHGKAGFIRSGEISYYFKTSDCHFAPHHATPNLTVTFCLASSFDLKKQKESTIAVNIARKE